MKFKFIYTFFATMALAVLFLSNSGGRAATQSWGNTGAPGDQELAGGGPRTCVSCHTPGSTIQVTVSIDVKDQNNNSILNDGYVPGETYQVEVTINTAAGSPTAFGFQIVCLNAAEGVNGPEVSEWSNASPNAQIATAANTGRTYVEQAGRSETNIFTADWVAPAADSGEVTFYSCGNGVNSNMANTGDGAACTTLTLGENTTVSTDYPEQELGLTIYPNPVIKDLNLSINTQGARQHTVRIYDVMGNLIKMEKLILNSGINTHRIDVTDLSKGTYILSVDNEKISISTQVIRL